MRNGKNIFWGLVFLCAGVCVILANAGVLEIGSYRIVASILIGVFGLTSFIKQHYYLSMFAIAYVGWMNRNSFEVFNDFGFWTFILIAFLLATGLTLLFPARKWRSKVNKKYIHNVYEQEDIHKDRKETIVNDDEDVVSCSAKFNATSQYLYSQNLSEVFLNAQFAALQVYFENAKPNPNGLNIHVNNSFAGMELYIPSNWNVKCNINASFGGVSEAMRRGNEYIPGDVMINGDVTLGGIKIIYI